MKNIKTIFRRDFAAYFTSPIGYLFIIVFLMMSVGLYVTSFFVFPMADMRSFFSNLPILLCVFIPAVTMRVWAEERKENTWEMLLTFPMRASELVLGKFLTCLAFFALALLATVTVPIMLAVLGNPDNGAIISGYLGTLLLGAFFLSIGIFFSGFCKDQIVAFVVTLLACFVIFLLGTDFIAGYLDSFIAGLGSLLSQIVGLTDHYEAFTRGVVEVADMLYFVAWTGIFLALNIMYIDARRRPKAVAEFSTAITLCVVIGLLLNWLIAGQSLGRFDMTEDKVYTVSDASKAILSDLKDPVQVKVYITPADKMPAGMKTLEQDILDKLREMSVASDGKVQFTAIHLEAANLIAAQEELLKKEEEQEGEEEEEDKAIETRMLDKGIQPFSVQAMQEDGFSSQAVYSSIGVGYRDKKEEIIPRVMPQNLDELEYRLISTIYKLTLEERPVVALAAPKQAINLPPEVRRMYEQMGQPIPQTEDPYEDLEALLNYEKYDVRRVDLTEDSPLPDEYDTLVVINPRELSDRQRWEINRALRSGKSVVMAVQNYEYDYQPSRDRISLSQRKESPQVNELLEEYGLGVDEGILMDVNNFPLTISGGDTLSRMLGLGTPVRVPMHILITSDSMNPEVSITNRLGQVMYLWGSALKLDRDILDKHGLEAQVAMTSSDRAWTVSDPNQITMEPPTAGGKEYPLMAVVSGQFPDAFADKPRPAWPEEPPTPGQPPKPPREEEPAAEPITPAPGKLVLLGCAEPFKGNFLGAMGNADLVLNSVDAVSVDENVVKVRGRKPIERMIDKPSTGQRALWKFINYALVSLIIAGVGIASTALRRRARNAYTMQFARGEKA